MKKEIITAIIGTALVIGAIVCIIKNPPPTIPTFSDKDLEFIQNEEGLK